MTYQPVDEGLLTEELEEPLVEGGGVRAGYNAR